MSDNIDGSSAAAQRAHGETGIDEDPAETGFFERMTRPFRKGRPDEAEADHGNGTAPAAQSHDILNLRRMRVEDVAIPKADIVAVPDTVTRDDLVAQFRNTGFSRLPIYSETLDSPVGMVHLKDFALRHGFCAPEGEAEDAFDLAEMIRPLLYVPPSMSIGVLLQKMQSERKHMALVIDEYGGVDGLVTIEDLIEQVIGEIEDEHDTEDEDFWSLEQPGQYLALAKTPLDEFEAETGIALTEADDIDPEEIDTLGGLVFVLSGRVPVRGEVVQHPAGPEFEVVDGDLRRIKRLRVRLNGPADV
jgi:magnesium and cobalt transporter